MKRESAYKSCMRIAEEEGSDFFDNVDEKRFKDITRGIRDKKYAFTHYMNFEGAFKETTKRVCPNTFVEKWDLVKNIGIVDIDIMFRIHTKIHAILRLLPFISALRYTKESHGRINTITFCMKITHVNRKALLLFGNLRAYKVEKEGVWYCAYYWGRMD